MRTLAALALLGLVACGAPKPTESTKAPAPKRAFPAAEAALGETFTVQLVSFVTDETEYGPGTFAPGKKDASDFAVDVSVTFSTRKAPTRLYGNARARRGKHRIGCKLEAIAPKSELDAGAQLDKLMQESMEHDREDSACSFHRAPNGRVDQIEVLTPDQLTGDDDDAGDGLRIYSGNWPVALRLGLRLASVPFPDRPLGPGDTWTVDEDAEIDFVPAKRHVTYQLLDWVDGGARVKVEIEETIASQTFSRFEQARAALLGIVADAGLTPGPVLEQRPSAALDDRVEIGGAELHAKGELVVRSTRALPTGTLHLRGSYAQATHHGSVKYRGTQDGTLVFR